MQRTKQPEERKFTIFLILGTEGQLFAIIFPYLMLIATFSHFTLLLIGYKKSNLGVLMYTKHHTIEEAVFFFSVC